MKVVLIDNFDSFTNNIAQYLYEVSGHLPVTVPNSTPYRHLPLQAADAVVLSPGPGRPSEKADFGVCAEVVARCRLPVLGVCLGHQGIAEFFGGTTAHAPEPVHGVVDTVTHTGTGLFEGLPQDLPVVRYHSLISTALPEELEAVAWNAEGLVMALAHRELPLWGVQFHPESIETQGGHRLLGNFLEMASRHGRHGAASRPGPAGRAFEAVGGPTRLALRAVPLPGAGTPQEEFARRYAGDPCAFWLDSENSEHPGAHLSVMGGGNDGGAVSLSYDLASRTLALEGPRGRANVEGDLFELLEQVTAAVELKVPDEREWPWAFKGGLVGYFGYELQALTSGAERYRSTTPDAWFLHTREFLLFDHRAGRTYLCTSDSPGEAPHEPDADGAAAGSKGTAAARVSGERDGLCPQGAAFRPGPVHESLLELRDDEAGYLDKVKRAQELIRDGESYEVCLTNRAGGIPVASGQDVYRRMRRISPVPYGAYLRFGDTEILSSSPETFLRVDAEGVIESRPIKGTRPRGGTAAQDEALRRELRASVKDRAENLMIVDLVRHDLNAVCEPGSVHVPEAFAIESYSSVHQMVSTVRGRLRPGRCAVCAVRACFPGGSMTGAPKKRTMEIIGDLEGEARGIYSGALGWLGFDGSLDLNIVIRTVVVEDGVASFGVGGAITSKSSPEEEFEEMLVKASVPYGALRGGPEAQSAR